MGGAGRSTGRRLLEATGPFAIEWSPKRVDDAPQQSIAHGHVHDPARALDFSSRVEMPEFAEQNDADFIRVHIERNAEQIAGERHQFIKAHAGKTRNFGDAGSDTGDRAHLPWSQLGRECFPHLAYFRKRAVENVFLGSQGPYSLALCFGLRSFRLRFGLGFRLRFGLGFRLRFGLGFRLRFGLGFRLGFGLGFRLGFRPWLQAWVRLWLQSWVRLWLQV